MSETVELPAPVVANARKVQQERDFQTLGDAVRFIVRGSPRYEFPAPEVETAADCETVPPPAEETATVDQASEDTDAETATDGGVATVDSERPASALNDATPSALNDATPSDLGLSPYNPQNTKADVGDVDLPEHLTRDKGEFDPRLATDLETEAEAWCTECHAKTTVSPASASEYGHARDCEHSQRSQPTRGPTAAEDDSPAAVEDDGDGETDGDSEDSAGQEDSDDVAVPDETSTYYRTDDSRSVHLSPDCYYLGDERSEVYTTELPESDADVCQHCQQRASDTED